MVGSSTAAPRQSTAAHPLLSGAAFALAGVAAATLLSARSAYGVTPALTLADIPGTGDVKVLNFALALEDLETDLYFQVLQRLTTGGRNKVGKVLPGLGLPTNSRDVGIIAKFAKVEKEHRDFLRASLGAAAIRPFRYDFGLETKTRQQADDLIYLAEGTGVQAYLGGIPLLATRKYLQAAGAIQGTEARHTAVVARVLRELFGENTAVAPLANQNNGTDQPLAPDAVLASVSPFIVVG